MRARILTLSLLSALALAACGGSDNHHISQPAASTTTTTFRVARGTPPKLGEPDKNGDRAETGYEWVYLPDPDNPDETLKCLHIRDYEGSAGGTGGTDLYNDNYVCSKGAFSATPESK